MEPCPICGVSVKAENMLRHVEDNHPNHPDTGAIKQRIREEARYAQVRRTPSGPGIRPVHIAIVAGVILLVGGLAWAAPILFPPATIGPNSCISEPNTPYHIHVSLVVVIDGAQSPIPEETGIEPGCTHPLHTHSGEYDPATQPARIHVESPIAHDFTLGDFFVVWRQTLTPTQVLGCVASGSTVIEMIVNAAPSIAFGNLVLVDGQVIRITCGPSA